ncbi:MAG: glycosyltransferase family 87 protein [bacterium]|nr:glycosyltransferase family 87 protein [bacterium]
MRIKTRGSRRIWWGIVILLWGGFILLNWVLFMYSDTEAYGRYDFFAYAKGAQALVDGVSPYRPQFDTRHLYLYPPFLAQILVPFIGTIGEPRTAALWFALNIACIIGTIQLMRRYTAPKHHIWLWVLPVAFIPMTHTLYIGQVTIILMFFFMLIWHDSRQGKPIRAGMWLALTCWIKVFPVFIVIYFILRRDWRVLRGVVIVGVGIGIFQILVSGIDLMIESFRVLLSLFTTGQSDGLFQNSSIAGFTARIFTEHPRITPLVVDNTLFQISRYGLMLFTIIMTYGMALWRGNDEERGFDLGYGAVIMMSLLVGYTLWITGMPPYMLAFWFAFRYSKNWQTTTILVVALGILSLYLPFIIDLGETRLIWWSTYSFGFYATYTLWGVLIYKLARR